MPNIQTNTSQIKERTLLITTADGELPVQLFSCGIQRPAVIVFHDAPGLREEFFDMARRIAAAGYCCVLPDLYYRLGHIRLNLQRRSESHAAVYKAMAASLSNGLLASDTQQLLQHLPAQTEILSTPAACIGFSIAGPFALQAAGLYPAQVAAAITVCGTELVTDTASPHLTLQSQTTSSRTPLLLEFAEHDPAVPAAVMETLRSMLQAGGGHVPGQLVVEPGTRHGYHFPLRPMYDAAAAERSWQRIFAFLGEHLPKAD